MNLLQNILNKYLGDKSLRTKTANKNSLYSAGFKVMSILAQLAIVPLSLEIIDKEVYGVWIVLLSFLAWVSFFDVGISNGLRNNLAIELSNGNYSEVRKLINTSYSTLISLSSILIIIFLGISPFINWNQVLNIKSLDEIELFYVVSIVFISIFLQLFLQIISSVLIAFQKTGFASSIPFISNTLAIIGILLIKHFDYANLLNLAIIVCGSNVLSYILVSLITYSHIIPKVFSFRFSIDFSGLKRILSLGVKFIFIQLAVVILSQLTSILILHKASAEMVTAYNISFRLYNIPIMFFSIITLPYWPAFTEAFHKKDFDWIKQTLQRLRLIWNIFFLMIVFIFFTSKFIIGFWIGKDMQIPLEVNLYNACFAALFTFSNIYFTFINGSGMIRLQLYITLVAMFLYYPLSELLIYLTNASLLSIFIVSLCIQLIFIAFMRKQSFILIEGRSTGIFNQ